jgi:hypothetical protein
LAFKNLTKYGIDKKLKELDFLRGDEEYKSRWRAKVEIILNSGFRKEDLRANSAQLDCRQWVFFLPSQSTCAFLESFHKSSLKCKMLLTSFVNSLSTAKLILVLGGEKILAY